MKVQNKKIIASILFVLISFVCSAQRTDPPPPEANGPTPPVGLPIDGPVYIVLAMGVMYGTFKAYRIIKEEPQ